MSEKIRRHSIVVTHDKQGRITGLQLEKDWFDYKFAEAYSFHVVEERPQGQFVFLSSKRAITQTQAHLFTDNILMGYIVVIDLSRFSRPKTTIKQTTARRA